MTLFKRVCGKCGRGDENIWILICLGFFFLGSACGILVWEALK